MLDRWRAWVPSPRQYTGPSSPRWSCNVGIVVTGGAVRLTASGLGCPTFPRCTDVEPGPDPRDGRARRRRVRQPAADVRPVRGRRRCRRGRVAGRAAATCGCSSAALFGGIVAQALLGGVTVLTGLNPVTVMAHFLLSMLLIAVATLAAELSAGQPVPHRPLVHPRAAGRRACAGGGHRDCCSSPAPWSPAPAPHSGDKHATAPAALLAGRGHPAARRSRVAARRARGRARVRPARHVGAGSGYDDVPPSCSSWSSPRA